MKEFCEHGWGIDGENTGECCCNCENQIELFKHPWNQINKGGISESTKMFVCLVQHNIDYNFKGIIFEYEHSYCELYVKKDFRKIKLKRIVDEKI